MQSRRNQSLLLLLLKSNLLLKTNVR